MVGVTTTNLTGLIIKSTGPEIVYLPVPFNLSLAGIFRGNCAIMVLSIWVGGVVLLSTSPWILTTVPGINPL